MHYPWLKYFIIHYHLARIYFCFVANWSTPPGAGTSRFKTNWWPSAVNCSLVGLLSLWHIPHFHFQLYTLIPIVTCKERIFSIIYSDLGFFSEKEFGGVLETSNGCFELQFRFYDNGTAFFEWDSDRCGEESEAYICEFPIVSLN